MAFNFQTFKTRALTALLFVAVMLVGLLWNFWSFVVLFTVIHFGCWFEYLKLVEKIYKTQIDNFIKWFFAICGFILMIVVGQERIGGDIWTEWFGYLISYKILFWILLLVLLIIFLVQNKQIPAKAKWMSFGGLLYISLSLTLFINLRDNIFIVGNAQIIDFGLIITCTVIFSIWINDTMAYLVGSFIGRTPLSKISPKKTIEGTVGGALLAVLVIGFSSKMIAFDSITHPAPGFAVSFDTSFWFIIPALCAIFGTLGDLFESKLKRMADVKDSGSFMPGHGGFLDRFDSLLFAVPAVWVYVYFFIG